MYGTGETILFLFVFASQVLLISWFFSSRVVNRINYLLEHYPPATHPKLYPKPVESYARVARNVARLNHAIVAAGLMIIALLAFGSLDSDWNGAIVTPFSTSGEWDAAIVVPFFMLQFVPFAYLELAGRRHYKAMKKTIPPRVRTTDLRRRRLVDFVSPAALVAAALTYAAFVAFILWYNRFGFPWFTAFGNIAIFTAMYVVMAASVGAAVYGRWPDHHQAHRDRHEIIKLIATRATAFVIAMPLLTMVELTIKLFDPGSSCTDRVCSEFLEPVIASVHVQIVAALVLSSYKYRVEKLDFDVYKDDVPTGTAATSGTMGSPHSSHS